MIDPLAAWARSFVGFLFVFSGVVKMVSWRRFGKQVASFGLLPRPLVFLVAGLIPPVEAVAGGLLLAGIATVPVLAGLTALLTGFTLFIVWVLAAKKDFSCFCFGEEDSGKITRVTLSRNLALLAILGAALALTFPSPSAPAEIWDRVLIAGYGLSSVFIFLSAVQLASIRFEHREAL
jgi:uncharacterized membrane protein YphA (DoxX/SURF4 family)